MLSAEDLLTLVQRICNGTSDKFVSTPTVESITEDILVGLKRFKNTVRWKDFWQKYPSEKKLHKQHDNLKSTIKHHPTGFKTNVKNPNHFPKAPKGSNTIKSFLYQLEMELLNELLHCKTTKKNERLQDIEDLMSTINANKHSLVVPTDKTNSFRVLETEIYDASVKGHLLKSGEEVNRAKIIEMYGNAHILLKQNQEALSKTEYHAIRSAIKKRNISTPKLLVKDHKKPNPITCLYPI